jgi:hypothetical protein
MVFVFIIIIFVIILIFSLKSRGNELESYAKKMGLDTKDAIYGDILKIIDGLQVPLYTESYILFHKKGIYIFHPNGTFVIDKNQVVGAHKLTNQQILETYNNNKSVIGRSLIGGAVFGGVGAVIGAISATTPNVTKEVKKENFLVITYMNSNQQFSSLIFAISGLRTDIDICVETINNDLIQKNPNKVSQL